MPIKVFKLGVAGMGHKGGHPVKIKKMKQMKCHLTPISIKKLKYTWTCIWSVMIAVPSNEKRTPLFLSKSNQTLTDCLSSNTGQFQLFKYYCYFLPVSELQKEVNSNGKSICISKSSQQCYWTPNKRKVCHVLHFHWPFASDCSLTKSQH